MSGKQIINLDNVYLKSSRGNALFENLSFQLESGRTAIITGAAGSGKSLFAKLLIGTKFTESGSVTVFDKILRKNGQGDITRIRKKIGGVGGMFTLIPHFTVAENILFPLILAGERKSVRKDKLFKILSEFSLLKQAGEYPHTLTRVEQTLVQFARGSIADQPLLLVDEPAAGLDKSTYQRIFDFLIKASLSGRSLIILSSDRPECNIPESVFYRLEGGVLK